ncbi:MAG: Mu transposase C-terminal domain-containing protein, partial [Cryobacterium sp.]|nr:Mu transposase C-terminal domain-containing protein [Cryobacterium sp.]
WLMERRRGIEVDLLNPRSNELLSVTVAELGNLICTGAASILRGETNEKDEIYAAVAADLAMFPQPDVEDAQRSVDYVMEILTRRLSYRPSHEDFAAAISRVAHSIGDPNPPQAYLVKRWVKRAIARAAAAGRKPEDITAADLIAQHGFKGNRDPRICFEVSKIISEEIERVYLTTERRSFDTLASSIRTRVRRVNMQRKERDQLRVPGNKAIRNAIGRLGRDYVLERRYGADRKYQALGPVARRERPNAPLDDVEVDHTKSDLFVVDGITGAPLGRAIVAFGVDRCTAAPWGVHVTFDPPSAHTVLQLLRNGMFPKGYVEIYKAAGVWDIKGTWNVCGRPRRLSVDRAPENLGHDIKALAPSLPIKVVDAKAGRKGRLKGGVERFLGTLNRTLLAEQRGTTFSNVIEREDYNPKKNAVITFEELLAKIHAWIIDVYMARKHNGIQDVPRRLWNEKILKYPPAQVENARELIPLFGRIATRLLRRDGIRFKGLFYQTPEIMAYLTDPEFCKHSKNASGKIQVTFRYDPSDLGAIQVYLPHRKDGENHVRVEVEPRSRGYATGLSVWAHDAITAVVKARNDGAVNIAELEDAKAKLAADLDRDMPESTKIRGRQMIARLRQIGGVAPYGDCVRTSPVGSFEDNRQRELGEEGEAAAESAAAQGSGKRKTNNKSSLKKFGGGSSPARGRSRNVKVPSSPGASSEPGAGNDDDIDYYGEDAPRP